MVLENEYKFSEPFFFECFLNTLSCITFGY